MGSLSSQRITVVGGGLAGCECAFQLARLGHDVLLCEQKPHRRSPAHHSDALAELVCSNSFRSDNPESAIGMLHRELRQLGSLILTAADAARVPAGDALAVDRERFGQAVEAGITGARRITLARGEVTTLPEGTVVVATGPLTSDAFAEALNPWLGDRLYFYDALAPIVDAASVDTSIAFRASRWGKGDGDDYLNLPLDEREYRGFVEALRQGEKVQPHAFEEPKYFEGCLPIEVMAERGDEVLAFGPMKPVGLVDPRTGKRPHAVVQLRAENLARSAWNLVGFQTRLTWPEQRRIFGMLPGLARAEWLRLGQVHRNTYVDATAVLADDLSLKQLPRVFLAGQIAGVEGYVESTACGLLTALALHARLSQTPWLPPPPDTALGALYHHLRGTFRAPGTAFTPSNVTYALFPELPRRLRKAERKTWRSARAQEALEAWVGLHGHFPVLPVPPQSQELPRA